MAFTPEYFIFSISAVIINWFLNFIYRKTRLIGLDILFIAPWLASINYGIYEAFVLLMLMFVGKFITQKGKVNISILALPPQVISITMGYLFGFKLFYLTLLIYYIVSTITVVVTNKFGMRYVQFVITNAIVNIVSFLIYKSIFLNSSIL